MRRFFQPLADCNQFVLSKSSVGHAAAVLNILTMWLAVMGVILAGRYFFGSPFLGWQEEIAFQSLLLLLLVGYRARLYSVNHQLMMRMWLYPIINSAVLFVLFAEMMEAYSVPFYLSYLLVFLPCVFFAGHGFFKSRLELCALLLCPNSDRATVVKLLKKQQNRKGDIRSAAVVFVFIMTIIFIVAYFIWMSIIPSSVLKYLNSLAFTCVLLSIIEGVFIYNQLCRIKDCFPCLGMKRVL